jgi:hypothetical protein
VTQKLIRMICVQYGCIHALQGVIIFSYSIGILTQTETVVHLLLQLLKILCCGLTMLLTLSKFWTPHNPSKVVPLCSLSCLCSQQCFLPMTRILNFPSSHMAMKFSFQVSVVRSERKLVKTHQISTLVHKYRRMIKYFCFIFDLSPAFAKFS